MGIPVITFVGRSGSGKTTLLVKLVAELARRQIRVAVIKHHPEPNVEFDRPGKDSWRLDQAGSQQVILATPDKLLSVRRLERELTLDEITRPVRDVDLILVEGFKGAGKPAVAVTRAAVNHELVGDPACRVAVVSDRRLPVDLPQFDLNDVVGIADWLVGWMREAAGD